MSFAVGDIISLRSVVFFTKTLLLVLSLLKYKKRQGFEKWGGWFPLSQDAHTYAYIHTHIYTCTYTHIHYIYKWGATIQSEEACLSRDCLFFFMFLVIIWEFHIIFSGHILSLSLTPPRFSSLPYPANFFLSLKKPNKAHENSMEPGFCWLAAPEHVAWPGVWLLYPVTFCWKQTNKLTFPFLVEINCK